MLVVWVRFKFVLPEIAAKESGRLSQEDQQTESLRATSFRRLPQLCAIASTFSAPSLRVIHSSPPRGADHNEIPSASELFSSLLSCSQSTVLSTGD